MNQSLSARKLRILLCGYGHLGLAILQGLVACLDICEIVGVYRWTSRPGGAAFWEPVEDDFKRLVSQAGLRDIQCLGMNSFEFTQLVGELGPDVVLVGSWGEILKPHILDLPGLLLVNCHPSRLPAHRGANPYASVILHGESETGVTFHRMAPKIDAGAILLQRAVPLDAYENGDTVRAKCAATAQDMVKDLVAALAEHLLQNAPLHALEQDHSQQSYYGQLKQEQGQLEWTDTPHMLSRQIRALYPWIVCYSFLEGKQAVLFFDPAFVEIESSLSQGQRPGTILSYRKGAVQIALSEEGRALQVSSYRIAANARFFLPGWLARCLAPLILRPGKRFFTPV